MANFLSFFEQRSEIYTRIVKSLVNSNLKLGEISAFSFPQMPDNEGPRVCTITFKNSMLLNHNVALSLYMLKLLGSKKPASLSPSPSSV